MIAKLLRTIVYIPVFTLDILTIAIEHPWFEKLDQFQCGLIVYGHDGHKFDGFIYEGVEYCVLCMKEKP